MKPILVNTSSKNYSVQIGNGNFNLLPNFIIQKKLPRRVFVITDKNVERIYGSSIRRVVNSFADKSYNLVLTASEQNKSFSVAIKIFEKLYSQGFGKDTLLIAIGGGTIGDVAGFIASTYMRGINLINIPTTLLASVDSSIGGKTGVNFKTAKNLIGTFYQPDLVLIDTDFIKSLSEEELFSGFGEVIKYSFLTNKKFYSRLLSDYRLLLQKDLNFLNEIVYESIKIKAAVVSKDEREITGLRKILNFGHTFAHAFESSSAYKLSHGNAVVLGIVSALLLSFQKKLIDENQLKFMLKLPLKFEQSNNFRKMEIRALLNAMAYDKKNKEGKNRFVLIKNFGELLVDVPVDSKSVIRSLELTEQIRFKRATAGL